MTSVFQTPAYPQQNYPPQQNTAPTPYPAQNDTQYTTKSQQPATESQVPVSTTTTNTTYNGSNNSRYNARAGVITGILQLIAAGILFIIGIVIMIMGVSGFNIWASLFLYWVNGILGISSRKKNRCVIVAYMVMSILSAMCAGGQMIYDISTCMTYSLMSSSDCFRDVFDTFSFSNSVLQEYLQEIFCEHAEALIGLYATAALVAFAQMVIAIVASCYCCGGACGTTQYQTTVVYTTTTQTAPGTTYPISTSPAYTPQGNFEPPPSYTAMPPQQSQQRQQAQGYEEKK